MLDIEYIRNNPEKIEKGSKNKGISVDIEKLLELDKKYKKALQDAESLRAQRNEITKLLSSDLGVDQREGHLKKAEILKSNLQKAENFMKGAKAELDEILLSIPNMVFDDVPVGYDESGNVVLRQEGKKTDFKFEPKDYLELAKEHDLIDIDRASKISGSRFGYLKNEAVILELALVRFAMDTLIKEGFSPVVPPVLIRPEVMDKLGYTAHGADEDIYRLEKDDLYLVGTSEQSIVPYFADEVLNREELPKRFAGFSTCFRREAGSYGKDTRGILRVHQFDKVEMVSFTNPEKSREEHEFLLSLQERLVKALEVPYQVVRMCTGDIGFPMAEKFDIESWIPSEGKYRETHSTSNSTDFQARRLNTRIKTAEGDKKFAHILNGTAYAVGRMLIAIIENHQDKDGNIRIPKVLQKYTGFEIIKNS